MAKMTIGEDTTLLLPEAERVRVKFVSCKPSDFRNDAERWGFLIVDDAYDNGDTDEDDVVIRQATESEYTHYENVTIFNADGKVTPRMKVHKLISGMVGRKLEPSDEIDTDDLLGREYLADFEHVDKQAKSGDGFVTVTDERGRPVKKAALAKIRPVDRKKGSSPKSSPKAAAPALDIPDDDDDLDIEEDEA